MAAVENPTNIVGAGYLPREVSAGLPAVRQPVPVSGHEEPFAKK